jgi:hypothetical protein
VEAAVEDNLHASVHLGSGDDTGVDLISDAGVNPRLQLLSREEPELESQLSPN